jgi:formate dehydrogenase beta subunit
MIRSQIPRFRLPEEVIDEEVGYILGSASRISRPAAVDSLKDIWQGKIRRGVRRHRRAARPRPRQCRAARKPPRTSTSASTGCRRSSFGHIDKIGKRVIVLGGGNTAMDCCRSSKRLGGEDVKVIVRSGFEEMKASPWEKEDASTRAFQSSTSWCRSPSRTTTASSPA